MIMCELDPSKGMPVPALECARINKQTMHKLGYTFRNRDWRPGISRLRRQSGKSTSSCIS